MGSESKGITIERGDDRLAISVRTQRSGDMVHYTFATIAVVFGLVVLGIGIANGTLFSSWVTLPLIAASLVYGWFALTRKLNRRVLVLDGETLSIADGPLFSLAPDFEVPVAKVGKITTKTERRWVPPISWRQVHHIESAGAPDTLFCNLTHEEDADLIRAALVSFVTAR